MSLLRSQNSPSVMLCVDCGAWIVYSHPRRHIRLLHLRRHRVSLLLSQNSPSVMLCVVARLLFDLSPFPKLGPKDEKYCGGWNQLIVGVLWRFAPGMGYATSIGVFVAGRLGFAGSLGIDALIGNGNGWWKPNMEGRSREGLC